MDVIFAGTYLTGTRQSEKAGPVDLAGQASVQVAPVLRGARSRVFGRDNKVLRINFSVTRDYGTLAAAVAAFFNDFFNALPSRGSLLLVDQVGLVVTVTTFANAALEAYNAPVRTGIAITRRYTFVTDSAPSISTITLPAPTAPLVLWDTIQTNWEDITTNWEALA